MSVTIVNPAQLHDPTGFGYSHIARSTGTEIALIAGQYAAGPTGELVATDFAGQVAQAFANLATAIAAAGLELSDVAQLRTYIVDHEPAKLAVIVEHVQRLWGDRPPAQTLLGVASLALPGMLFEVDATAVR